jgi:hypothetical protein
VRAPESDSIGPFWPYLRISLRGDVTRAPSQMRAPISPFNRRPPNTGSVDGRGAATWLRPPRPPVGSERGGSVHRETDLPALSGVGLGDRSINAVERREIISAELEKWTAGEILPRLLANDVPSAPALSRFELLQERQVRESGILEEHQSERIGRVRLPRPAALFDRTPARIRAMAPLLGEDNTAILAELGYGTDDIARLEGEQIVGKQSVK